MQVTREQTVLLFSELGIMTANKWNSARTAAKLNKLDEMVDRDTTVCDEVTPLLKAVMAAIKAEEDIEVVADPIIKEVHKEPKLPEPEPKAAKKTEKPVTEDKASTRTLEKLGGLKPNRSRSFFAGAVIKEAGIDNVFANGITDEMVGELDNLYGKPNKAESFYTLRDACHVIRGFVHGAE